MGSRPPFATVCSLVASSKTRNEAMACNLLALSSTWPTNGRVRGWRNSASGKKRTGENKENKHQWHYRIEPTAHWNPSKRFHTAGVVLLVKSYCTTCYVRDAFSSTTMEQKRTDDQPSSLSIYERNMHSVASQMTAVNDQEEQECRQLFGAGHILRVMFGMFKMEENKFLRTV